MKLFTALALWILIFTSGSYADFEFNLNDSDERQRDIGCQVATGLKNKNLEIGSLTTEQRLALDFLRQSDPARYQSCAGEERTSATKVQRSPVTLPGSGRAIQILDGKTFMLSNGGRAVLYGVQVTNEAGAREFLKSMILNKEMRFEYDIEPKDVHGRLLVVAYLGEKLVNRELILSGHASPSIPERSYYGDLILGRNTDFPEDIRLMMSEIAATRLTAIWSAIIAICVIAFLIGIKRWHKRFKD